MIKLFNFTCLLSFIEIIKHNLFIHFDVLLLRNGITYNLILLTFCALRSSKRLIASARPIFPLRAKR